MEQIMELLGKIDINKIMEVVKKVVAWVEESGIIEKVVEAVKGLIGNIA